MESFAVNPNITMYDGKGYHIKVTDSKNELNSFNNSNIPIVGLGECETLLKNANSISLELSLIILKYEKTSSESGNTKNFKFEVFHPITFEKLDISICENTTVDIYIPLAMSEEQEDLYKSLLDQGYDPFDLNDKFYREICTPYTSENGTDVLLDEREEFVYSTVVNESACMGNCKYSSYSLDNKYLKCECEVNSTYVTLDVKHISGENI